jgi:hypothetical protein
LNEKKTHLFQKNTMNTLNKEIIKKEIIKPYRVSTVIAIK